tara:strand:- start:24375 stop:27821 length:3447 start_codon:yes stop_codon:yes gene_type:complete
MDMTVSVLDPSSLSSGPSDTNQRKSALDISQSYAVSAPAGSGKTTLLVQRILRLLAISEQPEEILAITYTRKAAAEMRQRILQALTAAEKGENSGFDGAAGSNQHDKSIRADALKVLKQDQQRGWNLLQNPERLRLQTIDGFCSYLTQRLSLETGSSTPSTLTERPYGHYRSAAEALLGHMGRDDALGEAVRYLVRHFEGNQDNLARLLTDLLGSRASWLDLILNPEFGTDQLTKNLYRLIDEELVRLRRLLTHIDMAELSVLFEYSLGNLESQEDVFAFQFSDKAFSNGSYLASWQGLTNMLLTKGGTARKPGGINKKIGFPPKSTGVKEATTLERVKDFVTQLEDHPKLVEQLNRVRLLPLVDVGRDPDVDSENQSLSALASCLPILAAELKIRFANTGEADFSAVSIAALDALGEPDNPTRLNLRLDYRIRHILVDEFQDTSSLQVSLLKRLMAGWEPEDGRTLFLVGDAMQSIYGFRKANVGLFIRARELGIGEVLPESLDLSANFRSSPQIVEWVNQTFEQILPQEDDRTRGRVSYRASIAQKPVMSDSNVAIAGYLSAEEESEAIADSIEKQLAAGAQSIAILVRYRSHLRDLVPVLKQRNIPWQAQKIELLGQRMHVLDMHSLVRALHSPADRIAWLSLLRTPMLALDMSDLYQLCNANSKNLSDDLSKDLWTRIDSSTEIEGISSEGQQILAKLRLLMSQAQIQLGLVDLRSLVQSLWRSLQGDESLFNANHKQDLEDYLDLVDQQSSGDLIADLESFQIELDQLFAKPDTDIQTPLKIMTMHAAKGLEFDHLYLPQLQRGRSGRSERPALLWQEREYPDGHTGFLAAARPARGETDGIYEWLLTDEKERVRDESCRLLYVASTRAIQTLHLTGVIDKWDEKTEDWKAPGSNSLMALLWQAHQKHFCSELDPTPLLEEGNLSSEKIALELSGIRRLSSATEADVSGVETLFDTENIEIAMDSCTFRENLLQRLVGNLLHQDLMHAAQGHKGAIDNRVSRWDKELQLSGMDQSSREESLTRLESAYQNAISSDIGKWMLSSEHKESACELEIEKLLEDGSLIRSIVDRTFVESTEKGEVRWIIDYKSAVPAENQSDEEFLSGEQEKYSAQMARYRSLFDEEKQVKILLYFPAANLHQEIIA